MAPKYCPNCEKKFSAERKACPTCGALIAGPGRDDGSSARKRWVLALVLALTLEPGCESEFAIQIVFAVLADLTGIGLSSLGPRELEVVQHFVEHSLAVDREPTRTFG